VLDPLLWHYSTVTEFALHELENGGQLAPNVDGQPPAWIVPPAADREPNPPYGYVVSFIRHHERGFAVPTSRFMRGVCHHYGVELHNFAPNAISQVATFVGICEGFLGIPANWDLWVHLFRVELHTLSTLAPRGARRRDDDLVAGVAQGILHSLHDDLQQCGMGAGWFYLHNNEPAPYTSKVLKEKADSKWHGLSPSSRQDRLEPALRVLKSLADAELDAASVLANLHHRRIIPLMDRELRIFEMDEVANPVALERSRLVHDRFPREYAATWARRAISLKAVRHNDDDLWSFVMLPDTPSVSGLFPFCLILPPRATATLTFRSSRQRVTVNVARFGPPTLSVF
jgi:hypothetical protein